MKLKTLFSLAVILVVTLGTSHSVFAAGNIDPVEKYSQFMNIDLDSNGTNDFINWNPTNGGATVGNATITGNIWGETTGWINLNPTNGGVTNTCSGILGGYAWGQNTGWINFAPTNATGPNQPKINTTTGAITGTVWSQNYGWIQLASPNGTNSGLITTWNGCTTGGDDDVCPNLPGNQATVPSGYILQNGQCVYPVDPGGSRDLCLNIPGVQPVVPVGYFKVPTEPDAAGNCLQPGDGKDDVCPNIPGGQATVPSGYILQNGQCVIIENGIDMCLNISGIQPAVPIGYIRDNDGNCSEVISTTDTCPNLPGNQNVVPNGYTLINGQCVINQDVTDVCPNLPGVQTSIPNEYQIDINGYCVLPSQAPYDECPNLPGNQPMGTICTFVPTDTDPTGPINSIFSGTATNNNLSTVGYILGILGLLGTIPGLIPRIGNLLLAIPFFRRNRPYGTVFDSETKEPLDPVYVTVYDVDTNKVVDTKITDINGRYGFLLPKGNYRMEAGKTHYQFPSQKLLHQNSDGVYDHLYFGEVFSVTDDSRSAVVVLNIPMDKLADDWNQAEKKRMGIFRIFTHNTKLWSRISLVIFIIGFIFSIYVLTVSVNVWNIVVFALYVLFAIMQLTGNGPVHSGMVTDINGTAIPFAIIRVWNAHLGTQIAQRVTDIHGQYYLLITKGDYYVTIDVKNATGGYDRVLTSETMKVKHGVINKDFKI